MKIIAWILILIYVLAGVVHFISMFTENTTEKRVTNFTGLIFDILTLWMCVYVLRMI